jgi:transposase
LNRSKSFSDACPVGLDQVIEPTDMRFGINSLSGLVRNKLGFDPMNGDVFFIGKLSNQIRILQRYRDGFAMYVNKLEKGDFERPI